MENLVVDGLKYSEIYCYDENYLLKFSSLLPSTWRALKAKELEFLNTPNSVMELSEEEKKIIVMPIVRFYYLY